MFKKITLNNGLRIINVPSKSTQIVNVFVYVVTGSKYERKEEKGISHFLEHMCFKGTKKRKTPLEVAEVLDRVGGVYNAFTSQEYTGYFARVAKEHFDLALDWVVDIFLNSTLPEKEVEKERGVIIEEIRMRKDDPMDHILTLWQKLLYGDQPAGWDIAGEEETVSKIKREDLVSYRQEQYIPQNTIVCFSGNFNEKLAVEKVKKYFSKMRSGKGREKPKVVEEQRAPEILYEKRETAQTHICLGVRGVNIFDKRKYAQEILNQVLGAMMSSRLFEKIRTKMGIAYYISSESFFDPDTGYLVTRAGLNNEKVEAGIVEILKEYRKIKNEGITKEELKRAKESLKMHIKSSLETSYFQGSFFTMQEILEKKIVTPEKIFKEIDRVSQSDVLELARRIFRPENLNLALIGPKEVKKEILKI
jgi:predicted Zn-dependent peptidase